MNPSHAPLLAHRPCLAILPLLMVAAGLAGCGGRAKTAPPPMAPPAVVTRVAHFVGSPLSGPRADTVAAPVPADALSVRVTLVALENLPSLGLPLGSEARLITATRLGSPVLPSSRLTASARLVPLTDSTRFQSEVLDASRGRTSGFLAADGALPRGVTALFEARGAEPFSLKVAGAEAAPRMQILVHRPQEVVPPYMPQPIEIAVAVEDLAAGPSDSPGSVDPGAEAAAPASRQIVQREIVLLDRQITGSEALAVVVPFALGASGGKAIGALIEVSMGNDSAEHLRALSTAMTQLQASAAQVAGRPATLPVGRDPSAALRAAATALASTDRLRPTLVYLAGQTGARLAEDVSLVADDSVLAKLAEAARTAMVSISDRGNAADEVGWLLDKAALELLAKLLSDGKLPPELSAVLSTHAGEAGRNVGSMEEVSRNLTSRQDLINRLVAENLIYLEDSSPAARVRSFDWLNARGLAPRGFDPLAPARERRQALDTGFNAAIAAPPAASP